MGITAGAAGSGPVSIGGALSGIGLGYGAGSLAGGLVQSSLGKVGPGPQIGAGIGAGIGVAGAALAPATFGISAILAGLIGGVLGGAGGGLIGPKAATPFSATGLNATDGMLAVGQTFSQIVDVSQEVATLQEQTAQINAILAASNLRIANGVSADNYGQQRIIGGNSGTWLNFGQGDGRPGSIADAFGELRFSSQNDTVNRYLSDRSFANLETLQAKVSEIITFVDQTAPALIALGKTETSYGVGLLATTLEELNKQYDAAISMARELGHEEDALTNARNNAIAAAQKAPAEMFNQIGLGLDVRSLQARAINDNNPGYAMQASLLTFDLRAKQEREATSNQLLAIVGDAGKTTEFYIQNMARLESTLYDERLALLTQFNEKAVASDQASIRARGEQSALATISNIANFAASLPYGSQSPLSAKSQYGLARDAFGSNVAGLASGDFNAFSQLPDAANQFLQSSRNLYGSGAQYSRDFETVQSVLRGVTAQSPEGIVVQAIRASEAQQTAVMASLMEQMVEGINAILAETRLQAMRPVAA